MRKPTENKNDLHTDNIRQFAVSREGLTGRYVLSISDKHLLSFPKEGEEDFT
jgi:hypothetical protein